MHTLNKTNAQLDAINAERMLGRWQHTYGALDIGTHNCRLLIAKPEPQGFKVIDSFSRIVRLGEGVSASNMLNETAQRRAIDALLICAEKMIQRDVSCVRAVATQACRLAVNGPQFVKRVYDETGISINVIDPQEEAELAIHGCLPLMNPAVPFGIIFDIGGGSTQVILVSQLGKTPEIINSISIPYGVVTLGEEIGTDKLSTEIYENWVEEIGGNLRTFSQENEIAEKVDSGRAQMLGTSGTVTTLTGIHLALPKYLRSVVDGAYLSFEDARIISSNLRQKSLAERANHPCIGEDRADLVLAGCIILEAICRLWPVGKLRVADRGVREGILHGLMNAEDLKAEQG